MQGPAVTGWRGRSGPYTNVDPAAGAAGGGGGLRYSLLRRGRVQVIASGPTGGGGGLKPGTAAPLAGYGGAGGPGPGALIGVNGQ